MKTDPSQLIKQGNAQAAYDAMVANGVSPNLAEMFALQKFPGVKSETTYMANFGGVNGKQFENQPEIGDEIVKNTRKHDPNFSPAGKVFLDQLVRPGVKGDPEAWCERGEVRAHIKKVCEKRGWGCSGSVSTKMAEPIEPKPYAVAKDLVEKRARLMMKDNPKLKKGDAMAAAREKLTPKDLK